MLQYFEKRKSDKIKPTKVYTLGELIKVIGGDILEDTESILKVKINQTLIIEIEKSTFFPVVKVPTSPEVPMIFMSRENSDNTIPQKHL